ncbi:MAG: hypothetical protein JW776_13450 [Candidatus Lokiarchaeota archaeon]|nr:hypothetical protein [Candidatus Lokiarchaeota archaeon]
MNDPPIKINETHKQFHSLHPRYRWLDQLRGVIVFFLLIAFLTWQFSSTLGLGLPFGVPPLGPTWMNHGFKYSNSNPPIITVIDMGSSLFMFVLGISSAISFNSKSKKIGLWYAWVSGISRFFALLWVNQVTKIFYRILPDWKLTRFDVICILSWIFITTLTIILRITLFKKSNEKILLMLGWSVLSVIIWFPTVEENIWTIFFNETLAYLAWASLFAVFFLTLVKNPDRRILASFGLFAIHIGLWELAKTKLTHPTHWFFEVLPGTPLDVVGIPFNIINMTAIAISATCVSDWLLKSYPTQLDGIKKRILPYWVFILCFHFVVDFLQPARHDGITASLAALSIFFAIFFLIMFYAWDTYFDAKMPFLTPLGRNALLMFLLQGIYLFFYGFFWFNAYDFRRRFPGLLGNAIGLGLFFVPIALLICIAWVLDRFKIYLKF